MPTMQAPLQYSPQRAATTSKPLSGHHVVKNTTHRRRLFTVAASSRGDDAPVNTAALLDPPTTNPVALPSSATAQPPPTPMKPTPATALLLTGFAAVSFDVFAPSGAHLLASADAALHEWVVTNTAANNSTTAKLMSNMPILVGIIGWVTTTVLALVRDPLPGLRTVAISWTAYFLAAGTIPHGDPYLVDTLKNAFARARPSAIHSTYSFPSGHTTSAFFVLGVLLAVLLPAAAGPRGRLSTGTLVALWGVAGLTVAAGRVLIDAHWLSDTMAGACLGSALALLVYMVVHATHEAVD